MKGLNHLVTFYLLFNGLNETDTSVKPERWTGAYLVLFFLCLIMKYFKYIL